MQADEYKVKALESIFGGQDITASVIRTVLSSNENKFDEAVDSLLNMTNNSNNDSNNSATREAEPEDEEEAESEEALLDKKEREKIKTLENMFGGDLSNSVICTVLESNRGELVDTVDTLLNMTSKDINPYYSDEVPRREAERARQEEELKNYEEFKRLQLSLQEEEARAIKEQQTRIEDELRKSLEIAAAEEKRRQDMLIEQERILREFEAKKLKQQAEEEARRQAELREVEARRQAELREVEAAQEKLRRSWEEKLKMLAAEEEMKRAEEAKRREEDEARQQALLAMEEALRRKAAEQEEQIARARKEEEIKLAERRAQVEAEMRLQEELAHIRLDEAKREEERRKQVHERELLLAEKKRARQRKIEEEEALLRRRREEERALEARRLEEERLEICKAKAELEAMRRAQEQAELEEKIRQAQLQEEERLRKQRVLEAERQRAEEERQRAEEERRERERMEAERIRAEEESLRQEIDRLRQEEEEAARIEEENRNQALREEAEMQQAAFEEERRRKLAYDQLAASAVFIPPKAVVSDDQIQLAAVVSADTVICDWQLPEGTATQTNWIGLYPVRALFNTNKYVQFAYTNGAQSGQQIFRGVTPGQYEVRFFSSRGYEHAARSDPLHVGPSATLFAQLQGDTLLVYYTLDPLSSSPTREWLGIYQKGTRRNKEYVSTAYGNAEGQVMMKAPRIPGVYEVRLFATGSVYNEQCKCEFVVEDNDCVTIDPSSVLAGGNVAVSWVMRTVEPSSGDWVGLYRADEANNSNYLSSTYTSGASVGTMTIQAPKEAGVFEVRLFSRAKGKYVTFRTSSPLVVADL